MQQRYGLEVKLSDVEVRTPQWMNAILKFQGGQHNMHKIDCGPDGRHNIIHQSSGFVLP